MSSRLSTLAFVLWIGSACLATSVTAADWWTVHRADAVFDLPAARRAALETVAADPTSADSVAAVGWWLRQIGNLPDPEEILTAAGDARDPELGFLLARIEAELNGRAPSGVLTSAELIGPFGVFDTLDLDRGVAPPDAGLPPPNTLFTETWVPCRRTVTTLDGIIAPPDVMTARGVFTVLWTIRLDRRLGGWMAVEAAAPPEFLASGWWDPRETFERVYQAIRTREGAMWVFRDPAGGRWFRHGWFD